MKSVQTIQAGTQLFCDANFIDTVETIGVFCADAQRLLTMAL